MKIIGLIILTATILSTTFLNAQTSCKQMLEDAMNETNYRKAILKLNAAKRCDPALENTADSLTLCIFDRIERLKNEAEEAEKLVKENETHLQATLNSLKSELANSLGLSWLSFVYIDLEDGELDKFNVLNKTLLTIKKDSTEQLIKVNQILAKYLRIKGVKLESNFAKKYLAKNDSSDIYYTFSGFDFSRIYVETFSRKPEFALAEMELIIFESVFFWDNEQLEAYKTLIDVLQMENTPSVFERYGESLSPDNREMLVFLSDLCDFLIEPDFEKMSILASCNKFQAYSDIFGDTNETKPFLQIMDPSYIYYISQDQIVFGDSTFLTSSDFMDVIKRAGSFASYYHEFLICNEDKLDSLFVADELKVLKLFIYDFQIDENAINLEIEKIKLAYPYYIRNIADSLFKKKQYRNAIPLYEQILQLYPYDYWALSSVSYCLQGLKEYDKAFEYALIKQKYWDNEIWSYKDLRSLYFKLNDYKNAYKYAKLLIKLEPEYYNNYYNLSWYCLFVNKPEEAVLSARKTLELDSTQTSVSTNLALGYILNNEFKKANEIILDNRDKMWSKNETWKEIFLQDIIDLREAGINHKNFDKVKDLLK